MRIIKSYIIICSIFLFRVSSLCFVSVSGDGRSRVFFSGYSGGDVPNWLVLGFMASPSSLPLPRPLLPTAVGAWTTCRRGTKRTEHRGDAVLRVAAWSQRNRTVSGQSFSYEYLPIPRPDRLSTSVDLFSRPYDQACGQLRSVEHQVILQKHL